MNTLHGISSMATRALLAELAEHYRAACGVALVIDSVGGVDAARRVQSGEAFDFVVLASDAIDRLIAGGHVVAASKADLVRSGVAVAVRQGAAVPDISSEAALRKCVLAADSVGYSTGPSGVALAALFERWGITAQLSRRMVQAPPGIPVGSMVADGRIGLGFQQLSELLPLPGITVVGPLPPAVQITTTFTAGLCATSAQPQAVRAALDYLASAPTAPSKRKHGMEPA